MNKKNYESLVRSLNEAGQILSGEMEPVREFKVNVSEPSAEKGEGFALCIKSAEPEFLVPLKVYRATYSTSGLVGVTDEGGESAIYPSDFFLRLDFPSEVQTVLANLQPANSV